MRVSRKQFEMFERPNRYGRRENEKRYEAVVFLRSLGMRVFKVSPVQNKVDTRLLSNVEMYRMAQSLGWRP